MSFYTVQNRANKHFVYVNNERYDRLSDIALKDKSQHWIKLAYNLRSKEGKEADKLRYKTLQNLCNDSFSTFKREWLYFKFEGKDKINENIRHILYDYRYINENFNVENDAVEESYQLNILDKPAPIMIFKISLKTKDGLLKDSKILFSTKINSNNIRSIEGELDNFVIDMGSYLMKFNDAVHIVTK